MIDQVILQGFPLFFPTTLKFYMQRQPKMPVTGWKRFLKVSASVLMMIDTFMYSN